nr:hypothetical protein [Tanacetum cinerariifolium]
MMATTDKESSAAGTDNLPPMLVESDYESWKICIERDKTDEEFTEIENNKELADIQATNILRQGLLRHVFNIQNQTRTRKEIWDNLELLMKGSGKSLEQKKEELFDEYEQFRAIGNEPIHDYFVRLHKLINDMKITQLDIPNNKFVNNLPPYWAKYMTNVKNNMDISTTTYVELYTYLKSYEPLAMKTLKKQEQSSSIVDPLAYLASTTHHLTPTQPTNPPPSTSLLTLPPQQAALSSNDAMLETMNQIMNLLSGFQKQFPLTNNQLRTSSNSRSHATVTDNKGKLVICYNCRGEGHVSRQFLDAEAEAFLADVECTTLYDLPLAITTTNNFEVSHENAYDSDVDEGPHAAAAFMANLSSTSGTNGTTTSHVNEYQVDSEVQDVPTDVSFVSPGEISMITILDHLRNQLDGHLKVNREQSMVNDSLRAELARFNAVFEIKQLKEQLYGKDDTIRKLHTQINSMSMLNVEPIVGVKPSTGASKPMSKSDTRNHSTLPAKCEKARRVEDHHRNLDKQNHVDSHLNVKRIGFVLNSNIVCNTCNESLVFANHDNCVVRNLKSMNVKTPTAKHNVKTTKKVWKAKIVTISVWNHVRDLRPKCLYLSDIKLLLVAFDSQLKLFHSLKDDNTPDVFNNYLRQYSRSARISQSSALPTAPDEPASPLGDDNQEEAFLTVSGLEAEYDRENIIKTSALPHDSPQRVTSLAADEATQDLEITSLKARIKLLEDKDGGGAEPSREDSIIKGRSLKIREEAGVKKSTKRGSNDTEELMAREIEEQLAREDQRMNEQIAKDAEIARIHAEKKLQMLIDGLDRNNETIAKYLQEYEQFATDLSIEEKIDMINELVKYQDHYAKVLKYQSQQRKPLSKKQQREFYMSVLKSHSRWKTKHFKGMSLEEIREKFIPVWKQIEDFVPIASKEERERFKRKGLRLEQSSAKKIKTAEDVFKEDLKQMMHLVPVEEVYVEGLQAKHPIIDQEIHTEGQINYWKINRLGGSTTVYQFFVDMLKHFDREDLT